MKKITSFLCLLLLFNGLYSNTRPNVILILSDDQGINDLSCYGSEIPTPNIDSIGKEGIQFSNFYVAAPICTPSRYALLTGLHPTKSQDQLLGALMFLDPEHKKIGLHQHETSMAKVFKANGYQTALMGKWHLGHGQDKFMPYSHGFDVFKGHTAGCVDFYTMRYGNTLDWYHNHEKVDITGYATDIITDDAIEYINEKKDDPFFLFLPYNAPHFGKGWDDKNNKTVNTMQPHPDYLQKASFVKDITRRKYAAKVMHLDDRIGDLLKTLKKNKLEENTMVIFLSDHGGDYNYGGDNQPYRGQKATLFEGGLKVPCLIKWPKKIKGQQNNNSLLSSLDFFPTFSKLFSLKHSDIQFDGQDISPNLLNSKELHSRDLYWKIGPHKDLDRGMWLSYRMNEYKYILDQNGSEYLFNLNKDPSEMKNLIDEEKATLKKIKQKLSQLNIDN